MPIHGKKKVLAILDDLMFTVKIKTAAQQVGLDSMFVRSEAAALEQAKAAPLLIILDLNANSVEPIQLIQTLKSDDATKGISLLGFVSHVEADLKQRAHDAGCDMVMARSAFSQNLPQILKRHAGAAA